MDAAFEVARILGLHGAQSTQVYGETIRDLQAEVSRRQARIDELEAEVAALKAALPTEEPPADAS